MTYDCVPYIQRHSNPLKSNLEITPLVLLVCDFNFPMVSSFIILTTMMAEHKDSCCGFAHTEPCTRSSAHIHPSHDLGKLCFLYFDSRVLVLVCLF